MAWFHQDWSFNQETLTLNGFRRCCWISRFSALIQVTFSSSLIITCLWCLSGAHFRFQSLGILKACLECVLFQHRIVRLFIVQSGPPPAWGAYLSASSPLVWQWWVPGYCGGSDALYLLPFINTWQIPNTSIFINIIKYHLHVIEFTRFKYTIWQGNKCIK